MTKVRMSLWLKVALILFYYLGVSKNATILAKVFNSGQEKLTP